MKRILAIAAITAPIAIGAIATPALAGERAACGNAPREQWLGVDAVKAKLVEQGYDVRRIEVEKGCYEAYALKDGKRREIYLNPVTGEIVRHGEDD